jgi:uncharacterized membrane protein YidH (DUF202 family)
MHPVCANKRRNAWKRSIDVEERVIDERRNAMAKASYRMIAGADDPKGACPDSPQEPDALIINEAQLILAEKRTSLAAMRTGIAVFALPLSVLGLMIATSRYYDVLHVLPLILPMGLMLLALFVLGSYLIIRALRNVQRYDRMIDQLKTGHSKLSKFLS